MRIRTPAPAFSWASAGVPKPLLGQQHPAAHTQPPGGFRPPWDANPTQPAAHTQPLGGGQTPVGRKPRTVFKRYARRKVSPVPPAGFLGPLGVAATEQRARKMLVTGITENVSLLVKQLPDGAGALQGSAACGAGRCLRAGQHPAGSKHSPAVSSSRLRLPERKGSYCTERRGKQEAAAKVLLSPARPVSQTTDSFQGRVTYATFPVSWRNFGDISMLRFQLPWPLLG